MRSILFASLASSCVLLMTGCGETRSDNIASPVTAAPNAKVQEVTMPDWVMDPCTDGQFGAVGISRTSLGGSAEEFARALANGRTELARTINVRVQSAYIRFFTEGGSLNQATNGGVEAKTAAEEMSTNVSRQLTDQVLSGSRQKAIYRDPNTKEVFMWVIISPDKLEAIQAQVKQEAQNQVAKRAQISAELKTQEALKMLDAAIDKEMNRQGGSATK